MNKLKIISAKYYDPDIGEGQGTDVTTELSALIRNGKLFYYGTYNNIFPDHFKTKHKRLKIELKYKRKKLSQFYNENEKINLPADLGIKNEKWWEKTWVQIIVLLGSISGIIGLYALLKK